MPDIPDGASVEVAGSKGDKYILTRSGANYRCTCPAWQHGKGSEKDRRCKHLKAYLSEASAKIEKESSGSDSVPIEPKRRGVFREDLLNRAERLHKQGKLDEAGQLLRRVSADLINAQTWDRSTSEQYRKDHKRFNQLFLQLEYDLNTRMRAESEATAHPSLNSNRSDGRANDSSRNTTQTLSHGTRNEATLSGTNYTGGNGMEQLEHVPPVTPVERFLRSTAQERQRPEAPETRADRERWNSWLNRLPNYREGLIEALSTDNEFKDKTLWELLKSKHAITLITRSADERSAWLRTALSGIGQSVSANKRSELLQLICSRIVAEGRSEASWLSELFDQLGTTPDEQLAYQDCFWSACSRGTNELTSWGISSLRVLCGQRQIDGTIAFENLSSLVQMSNEEVRPKFLKLALALTKNRSLSKDQAIKLATQCLRPEEKSELHKVALDVIEEFAQKGDEQLVALLRTCIPHLRGKQLDRLVDWLGGTVDQLSPQTPAEQPSTGGLEDQSESSAALEIRANVDALLFDIPDFDADLRDAAGIDAAAQAARGEIEFAAALTLRRQEVPHLAMAEQLKSIDTLNDLIFAFSRVIDRRSRGEEIEQVLDGLSRLCADRPPDFGTRVARLKERALNRLQPEQIQDRDELRYADPFSGVSHQQDLAALALLWTDGDQIERYYQICPRLKVFETANPEISSSTVCGITLNSFFAARTFALAQQILRREPQPLLSAPTHSGGWIDPRTVVARMNLVSDHNTFNPFDITQSLLRLSYEHRSEALQQLNGLTGEIASAFRYALGGEQPDPSEITFGWLWSAACRARDPLAEYQWIAERFPDAPADTCLPPKYQMRWTDQAPGDFLLPLGFQKPQVTNIQFPTNLFHSKPYLPNFELQYNNNRREWEPLVWPQWRESYFAGETRQVLRHLQSTGKYWLSPWEPLFDPDTYANGNARYLVLSALNARREECIAQGIEALTVLIRESRVDPASLGDALAMLLRVDLATTGRTFKGLTEATKESPLHLLTIKRSLEQTIICFLPKFAPTDVYVKLQELCLASQEGVTSPACRQALQAMVSTLKYSATLPARELLSLPLGSRSRLEQEATAQVLQTRIERLMKWQSARDGKATRSTR
jgi:hypothetical protein